MQQSLAQQSQARVPDLVIPHRQIYQRRLVAQHRADVPTAIAGYSAVFQAAGKKKKKSTV